MNRGNVLVLGVLGVALALAAGAVWYNFHQMQRILVALTPTNAELIVNAPQATIAKLEPAANDSAEKPTAVRLLNFWYLKSDEHDAMPSTEFPKVRHWFVRDNNFEWDHSTNPFIGPWQYLITFTDGPAETQLTFDITHSKMLLPSGEIVSTGPMNDSLKRFFATAFLEIPGANR